MQTGQQKLRPNKPRRVINWHHITLIGVIVIIGFSIWILKKLASIALFSIPWIHWTLIVLAILFATYTSILFWLARKQKVPWRVLLRRRSTYIILTCATLLLISLIGFIIWILSLVGAIPGVWSGILIALFTVLTLLFTGLAFLVAYLTYQFTIRSSSSNLEHSIESLLSQSDPPQPPIGKTPPVPKDSHTAQLCFFISYCDSELDDKEWAKWSKRVFEDRGYSIIIRSWDLRADETFLKEMEESIRKSACTIMIVSPAYLKALATWPTWATVFTQEDQTGRYPGLLLAHAQPCKKDAEYTEILQLTASIELFVLDKSTASACKKLLDEVEHVIRQVGSSTL